MHHDLKIEIPYYEAVASGEKTFEVRYNDRGFQKGDTITLKPWEGGYYSSSKKSLEMEITYVTSYNQKEGWCVFGIKPITKDTK